MLKTIEKVVVIIPTYNEEQVIANTILQVFAATESLTNFQVHILIFDSASTDNTQQIVRDLMQTYREKLYLQTEPYKTGLGSAYAQAMHYALSQLHADIVVEFDADLSHQPVYLEPILNLIKTADVVIGSRYIQGGQIPKDWAFYRKLLSLWGNQIARLLLTSRFHDFTSGFRATRREVLLPILPERFISNHYAYKLHLLWLLHHHKARILEFPIHFIDRRLGDSKLPANSIKDALRVIFHLRYLQFRSFVRIGNNKL